MRIVAHFLLFIVAWLLILPLTIINLFLVWQKDYFLSTSRSIDVWANYEFRTLWNTVLIKSNGYKFGVKTETISSALGKNERDNTLTNTGKVLVFILDLLDKDHCKNAISL